MYLPNIGGGIMGFEREINDSLVEEFNKVEERFGVKLNYIVYEEDSIGDTYEVFIEDVDERDNSVDEIKELRGIGIVGEADTILGALLDFDIQYSQSIEKDNN